MVARVLTILLLVGCGSSQNGSPAARERADERRAKAAAKSVQVHGTDERVFYYPGSGPLAAYAPGDRGPFLIDIRGPLTGEERAKLAEQGVAVAKLEMFTENTFVARLAPEQRDRVAELPFVWEVRLLQPDDKLEPTQFADAARSVELTIDLLEVSDAKLAAIAELLVSWGAEVRDRGGNSLRIAIDKARVDEITRISDVIWIETALRR